MSQNIPDESQTPTEQPTSADLLGKMSESIETLLAAQEKLVKASADVAKHTTDPNAHGAATLANIAKALPTPVLEDGMFTFKDADGNDIIGPVNLKGDTGEKGEKGDDGAKGDKGDMPDHRWNGTSLQIQNPDGSWGEEQNLQGPKGENGIDGTDGTPGQAPEHQWNGTSLQFKNPDGTWGEEQNLQGPKGEDGSNGAAPEHEWNGTSLKFKNPDGTWGEEQNLQGPQGAPGDAAIATAEQPGIVQPDSVTTRVDEDGVLSALGGNLQLNSKIVITESGGFTVPRTGWYAVICIGGGAGGYVNTLSVYGGPSGAIARGLVYLDAGDEVPVVVGAGGLGIYKPDAAWSLADKASTVGGSTSFGDHVLAPGGGAGDVEGTPQYAAGSYGGVAASGAGVTAFDLIAYGGSVGYTYGFGGNSRLAKASGVISTASHADSGEPGAIILYYHHPDLAAGPQPVPALLSARRMGAARGAVQPAAVSLYDPESGQGSVWKAEDEEAKLAEGLVSKDAWQQICAARAAEEYDAWLASPESEAERFAMLRAARKARLAEYDTAVAQLRREERAGADVSGAIAAWDAYANALCALPQQPGAPWDGGGELTPWPEMPAVSKAQPQPEATGQTEELEV